MFHEFVFDAIFIYLQHLCYYFTLKSAKFHLFIAIVIAVTL